MNCFRLSKGLLFLGDAVVDLPGPVGQIIETSNGAFVRLAPPVGEILNRNVFLVRSDGSIQWQIEESPHGTGADKPFMQIWLANPSRLCAGNWNGVDYEVDIDTGAIKACAFNR